jgi:hypothetical protein
VDIATGILASYLGASAGEVKTKDTGDADVPGQIADADHTGQGDSSKGSEETSTMHGKVLSKQAVAW